MTNDEFDELERLQKENAELKKEILRLKGTLKNWEMLNIKNNNQKPFRSKYSFNRRNKT